MPPLFFLRFSRRALYSWCGIFHTKNIGSCLVWSANLGGKMLLAFRCGCCNVAVVDETLQARDA